MRQRAASVFWTQQSRTWDERLADPRIAARVDELAGWLAGAVTADEDDPVVVDLGCGTGTHAAALSGRSVTVVGIERSPGMAARARAKGIAVVQADLGAGLPLAPSAVEGALSVYSLQFLDAPAVLRDVRRVVRDGAPVVVEVPRSDGGRRPDLDGSPSRGFRLAQGLNRAAAAVGARVGLVRTFTGAELDRLLTDTGFEVVEHRDTVRSVAALARATGRGAAPGPRGDPPSRS